MKLLEGIKSVFDLSKWTDEAFTKSVYSAPVISSAYRGQLALPDDILADLLTTGFMPDGRGHNFLFTGIGSSLTAYCKCAPVAAIINKKAQAFVNGKTWVLNSKGKESDSPDAKKIRTLLAQPNPLQSWKQFEAQAYIYTQLFGYSIVLPIKPVGFDDPIYTTRLWNIPPFMCDIEENDKMFVFNDKKTMLKSVKMRYKNSQIELNPADLFLLKDFSPSFESIVIPDSRIRALEVPINNIIGAYESRNVLINKRGALGIFSSDKSDNTGKTSLTKPEKEDAQREFARYGLLRGQWQYIITQAALKWQQVGYPTRDLMLFEEIEGSTMAVCDGYGYPYRLMAAEKSASYNDVSEFKKMLYQDSMIPEAESFYEQWNYFFDTENRNLKIDKDFSHVAVLQEDEMKKAQARNQRNQALEKEYRYDLITLNRWRELNGEDPLPDGNVYFSEWILTHADPYGKGMAAAANPNQDPNNPDQNNNNSNNSNQINANR